MTSSRPTSCRIFAIHGPVKLLNRGLPREASGDAGLGRLGRSSAALDGMPLSPAPSRSSRESVIKTTEIGAIYMSKKLPMFELITKLLILQTMCL
jgi:hypothetical protein